jgi:hypothetical protein
LIAENRKAGFPSPAKELMLQHSSAKRVETPSAARNLRARAEGHARETIGEDAHGETNGHLITGCAHLFGANAQPAFASS